MSFYERDRRECRDGHTGDLSVKMEPRGDRKKLEWCSPKLREISNPQKLEKARNKFSPKGFKGNTAPDFSPEKLISDSGLQSYENILALLSATKPVLMCCSGHRMLIQTNSSNKHCLRNLLICVPQ